jgi:superfamily II DNA or RNA helicase
MIQAILKDGLWLLNPPEILSDQLKELLTYNNPAYTMHCQFNGYKANPHPPKLRYWSEDDQGNLKLPRNFVQHEYAQYLFGKYQVVIRNDTVLRDFVNLGNPIVPRNEGQIKAITSFVKGVREHNDGLLIAPTGSGKTVMLLEVARQLGQPTLWLTHRKALMTQGAKRARTFLGIEPGFIGDGQWDIKPLTFAIVNTLARRDIEEIKKTFGTVIIDEVHLFAAEYYMGPIFELEPRYMLGTTATPNRRDGFFNVVTYTIGSTLYEVPESEAQILDPEINLVKMTELVYTQTDTSALRRKLAKCPERNKKIVSKLTSLLEDNRRKILLFAIDQNHAKLLVRLLNNSRPDAVVELIISSTSENQREEILDRAAEGLVDVLITIKIAREGLDVPAMTTGFHTSPHDNVDQLNQEIGRVRRVEDGKELCEWFDCVDFGSPKAVELAKARLSFYKSKSFTFNK